jgi:hypothetical protein
MAIETTSPRSRRALLGSTVGGVAAPLAASLGRAQPARAHDPDDVRLGGSNSAVAETVIYNSTNNQTVLSVASIHSVAGTGGAQTLTAHSDSGTAIFGGSKSLFGVWGQSVSSWGVTGSSATSAGIFGEGATGVHGQSYKYAGVYGSSGANAPSPPSLKVGVYGWGPVTSGLVPSYGVIGKSASALGIGVLGSCDAGVGVSAVSKTGFALYAGGRVQFKTSGLGSIAVGSASAVVTPGVPIGDGARILVTLHGDAGGSTVLKRVSRNTTAGTFKVILTAASANPCAFSWFLIG